MKEKKAQWRLLSRLPNSSIRHWTPPRSPGWGYDFSLLRIPLPNDCPSLFILLYWAALSLPISLLISAPSFGQALPLPSFDNDGQTWYISGICPDAPVCACAHTYLPAKYTHTYICTYSICISLKTPQWSFCSGSLPCPPCLYVLIVCGSLL